MQLKKCLHKTMHLNEETFTISYNNFLFDVSTLHKQQSPEYILFLHGIQSNKELFLPLLQQNFLENYSLLALDDIGFGNSSKPEDFSYDVEDQAKIIALLVEQLEIKKLHIIGHSLGGVIGTLLSKLLEEKIISF